MGQSLQASSRVPSVCEFTQLRSLMAWGEISRAQAEAAIESSLAFATIYDGDRLLAMGRVVGDGALFFYLQDIAVHPEHQRQGLGRMVLRELESYLAQAASPGASIALLAAKGKEGFYKEFDYLLRDGNQLGYAMCKFVP